MFSRRCAPDALDVSAIDIGMCLPFSWHDEGIMRSPAHCGRVRRQGRRLPTSVAFGTRPLTWSSTVGYSYISWFSSFLCTLALLTFILSHSEPQVEQHNPPDDLPMHSMHPYHEIGMDLTLTTSSSRQTLSCRRIGPWLQFYNSFNGYFYILEAILPQI
jgi:hypothetical protein